jgi:hypothetical protein
MPSQDMSGALFSHGVQLPHLPLLLPTECRRCWPSGMPCLLRAAATIEAEAMGGERHGAHVLMGRPHGKTIAHGLGIV